ncbi:MAG TPA: hypothetical protein DGR79_04460 [Clostridiales bacterium]|nr:hypothetical protein [Clostridiales bacterium]
MVLMYFLLGAVAFWAVQALLGWAKREGVALAWYHWLGVAVVALWALFVAAWIGTSVAEGYPQAATAGGLIFGGIGLVLFILLRLLIVKTARKTSASA